MVATHLGGAIMYLCHNTIRFLFLGGRDGYMDGGMGSIGWIGVYLGICFAINARIDIIACLVLLLLICSVQRIVFPFATASVSTHHE